MRLFYSKINKAHLTISTILFLGLLSTIFFTACASKSKNQPVVVTPAPTTPPLAHPAPTTEPSSAPKNEVKTESIASTSTSELIKTEVEKNEKIIQKTEQALSGMAAAHHQNEGINPDTAFGWLKNGNVRFTRHRLRNDGQSKKDIKRLSDGQKPHSIILSCSDSRVPPELVFDQKLGEIFVVRTAGQSLDGNVLGSIEYAVEHLGAKNIVVMGHSKCGAIKAAVGTLDGSDAGGPNLNRLVQDLHPRLIKFKGGISSPNYEIESWSNVEGVAKDLTSRSHILTEKIKSGEIKIRQGLYSVETGIVNFR